VSQAPSAEHLRWLVERSMLAQARELARRLSGQARQWHHPYAAPRPRDAVSQASVWFTAYPASIICPEGASVLATLGDPALWQAFATIGIQGMHTGPMKRAGAVHGDAFTPSVDGHFDRIGLDIDPQFGTLQEYRLLVHRATAHGGTIIGDIIPGHTGKGPDFRLAELGYQDYPGIYHMVAIPPEDWDLLPPVPPGQDAVNLSPATVEALAQRGHIVGRLQRVIFHEPGVKESNWSATPEIRGVDGVVRRWVYLHYFKQGQPTLNWLDPSFGAARLVSGDAIHSREVLGATILRLDANGFLGVERTAEGVWSEGHPLSVTVNQLLAGLVRKLGGFTFQELNLALDDIAAMAQGGPDLSYDFITRPAYHHALVTGRTDFLRLMFDLLQRYRIEPVSLIHGLQNHDELTLELVHFWHRHGDEPFLYRGRRLTGQALRAQVREEMYARLSGPSAPYNLPFATNGVACTTASVVAAALGIRDLTRLEPEAVACIQRGHLLLALFNAFQPGVFALSGWDLVGALPLPKEAVADRVADGDTRWIHRGAYDLMDGNPGADRSPAGIPRAPSLYGSLPEQLERPDSFLHRLRHLLAVREGHGLATGTLVAVPSARHPGLLVLVHRLASGALQATCLNFSQTPVDETVPIPHAEPGPVQDLLRETSMGPVAKGGRIRITLGPWEGTGLLIAGR